MPSKGRSYTQLTLKRLYALSGNQCAFPGCQVTFLSWEDDTNYSNICHIEDANPNTHKADRYNPNMTDAQRSDYDNLILLCPTHHITTNDPAIYTADNLKALKRSHEDAIRQRLAGQNVIARHPSALSLIVNQIGSQLQSGDDSNEPITAPDPEEKISYNNIIEYKPIIETYKVYQGKLNKIYQEIESQGSTKKELVLKNINTLYLREKGKYAGIEELRKNSDNILRNIEKGLWQIIEQSNNQDEAMPIEAIEMGLLVVMVDAFMRCGILEEPPRNDS